MSPYLELGNPKIERKGPRSDDGKLEYRIQAKQCGALGLKETFSNNLLVPFTPVPDIFSTTQWI